MHEEDRLPYATLETRLRSMGLGRAAESVLQLARPAIRLDLTPTEETAIPVGTTKVGGSADLPPGAQWPLWRGGPLPFVTQLRLEEVAALDPEGDLPHAGLLSFFFAATDPESGEPSAAEPNVDPNAWHVLYTPDASRLQRRQAPPWPRPERLWHRFQTAYSACAVTWSRRLTLPDAQTAAVRDLGLTDEEQNRYLDLVLGESAGFETEMDHRLLGYPYTLNPDPFLSGYLARNGIERPTLPEDQAGQERLERAKAILAEQAQTWRLPLPADHRGPEDGARAIADLTASVDIASLHRALAGLEPPPPPPPDYLARMEELRRAAEAEWRLLLQIYGNEEAEMELAGDDVLHLGIPRADLAARDFSRVWVHVDDFG
jgi:Domain of unknown function (DUF1963)